MVYSITNCSKVLDCIPTRQLNLNDIQVDFSVIIILNLFLFSENLDSSSIFVIPSAIRPDSVACVGLASKFNITWQPSTEVNHGHVTYKLSVKADGIPDMKEV